MKIGLVSDTHIAAPEESLPPELLDALEGVDLILHAGDIWIPSVLDELETVAPVVAAWGDDDMESDLGGDSRMAATREHYIDDSEIWLVHEKPPYGHIVPRENKVFSRQPVVTQSIPDVVVYGHTHKPLIELYKGVLIVNPGSPTWPYNVPELGTIAILTIGEGKPEAHHVSLKLL